MLWRLFGIGAWLCLFACQPGQEVTDAGADASTDAGRATREPDAAPGALPDAEAPSVQVGVPAGDDGLGFEPMEPGQELRLQTFGQGGTHLMLGVRCRGFGNRAYVSIALRNLKTGAEAVSPAPVRPQLLWCHDDGNCDLVPLLAMTAGLVEPGEERDGLEIEVEATVTDGAGLEATTSQRALLSTADL